MLPETMNFIESNYPSYYACDLIDKLNDLNNIVDGIFPEGSSAHNVLIKEYGSNVSHPKIAIDLLKVMQEVWNIAMVAYIEKSNNNLIIEA